MRARCRRTVAGAVLAGATFLLTLTGCDDSHLRIAIGYEGQLETRGDFVTQVQREFLFQVIAPWPSEDIVEYAWDLGGGRGELANSASGSYRYEHVGRGTYNLSVTVRTRKGAWARATVKLTVEPVVWICDASSNDVRKLTLGGEQLSKWELPLSEPQGLALVDLSDKTWLYVACADSGHPRIIRLDPATGEVDSGFSAEIPGLIPRFLSYADLGEWGRTLWHVDVAAHFLYLLDARNGYIRERYDKQRMTGATDFILAGNFLREPMALDYGTEDGVEYLWFLEGEDGGKRGGLYKVRVTRRHATVWSVDLQVEGEPVQLDEDLFPITGIVFREGELWVVSTERGQIVAVDPDTGHPVRVVVPRLPGSATSGLDVQS